MDDSHSLLPSDVRNGAQPSPVPSPLVPGPSVHPDDERDTLFIKLMFAARRLAEKQVCRYGFTRVICQECAGDGPDAEHIEHFPTCNAGLVESLIGRIAALYERGAARAEAAPAAYGDFGEPWFRDFDDPTSLRNQFDFEVCDGGGTELPGEEEERYAGRIMACVNACAGVPTAALVRGTKRPPSAQDLHGVDALFGCKAPDVKPFDYPEAEGGAQ